MRAIGLQPGRVAAHEPDGHKPPPNASLIEKRIEELQVQGHIVFETAFLRQDGTSIPIEASSRVIEYDEKPAILSIARDITERKKAEEAEAALQAQLQQAQKMESIGRLAGGLAHDINNLMTAVLSYSSFLLASLDHDDPRHRDAEEIKKAGKSVTALVQHLLAFSRRQVLRPTVLDLNQVLTVMEKMLHRLLREDLRLVTDLEPDLGRVEADPAQIEQIIVNLAVNARDAMPEGGELTIKTSNIYLDQDSASEVGTAQSGPYVILQVSDTGVGMDQETQSQIFEPFFTTKKTGKGTGLGLSTVYGIVTQSNGHIQVSSSAGKGTTFRIYLPKVEGERESFEEKHAPVHACNGSETVLVVEGHEMVRHPLKRILEGHGYSVLEAQHGDEALEVSGHYDGPIHLMVTDVVMPGMSGMELAKRLHTSRRDMKVLYISGAMERSISRHGVADRDAPFLQKPFTPEELSSKVREVLDAPPVP